MSGGFTGGNGTSGVGSYAGGGGGNCSTSTGGGGGGSSPGPHSGGVNHVGSYSGAAIMRQKSQFGEEQPLKAPTGEIAKAMRQLDSEFDDLADITTRLENGLRAVTRCPTLIADGTNEEIRPPTHTPLGGEINGAIHSARRIRDRLLDLLERLELER